MPRIPLYNDHSAGTTAPDTGAVAAALSGSRVSQPRINARILDPFYEAHSRIGSASASLAGEVVNVAGEVASFFEKVRQTEIHTIKQNYKADVDVATKKWESTLSTTDPSKWNDDLQTALNAVEKKYSDQSKFNAHEWKAWKSEREAGMRVAMATADKLRIAKVIDTDRRATENELDTAARNGDATAYFGALDSAVGRGIFDATERDKRAQMQPALFQKNAALRLCETQPETILADLKEDKLQHLPAESKDPQIQAARDELRARANRFLATKIEGTTTDWSARNTEAQMGNGAFVSNAEIDAAKHVPADIRAKYKAQKFNWEQKLKAKDPNTITESEIQDAVKIQDAAYHINWNDRLAVTRLNASVAMLPTGLRESVKESLKEAKDLAGVPVASQVRATLREKHNTGALVVTPDNQLGWRNVPIYERNADGSIRYSRVKNRKTGKEEFELDDQGNKIPLTKLDANGRAEYAVNPALESKSLLIWTQAETEFCNWFAKEQAARRDKGLPDISHREAQQKMEDIVFALTSGNFAKLSVGAGVAPPAPATK
ncbi:MAG: hypothetical protein LBR07_04470 [Puniceicoccales bacterium]|nr:hypothetical protein [Puniceicoccales bacterium]